MLLFTKETHVNETRGYRYFEDGPSEVADDWTLGDLFRHYRKVYGRCISALYFDTAEGKTIKSGWVFQSQALYDDWRSAKTRADKWYSRVVWVEVWTKGEDGKLVPLSMK